MNSCSSSLYNYSTSTNLNSTKLNLSQQLQDKLKRTKSIDSNVSTHPNQLFEAALRNNLSFASTAQSISSTSDESSDNDNMLEVI